MIGTLNEGALHAQLKDWYRRPGDQLEEKVAGYVIDLVRGELLVEIQTGGLAPLRRKLDRLTELGSVRLVVPVALTRRIVRLSADGEVLSARRSPQRGRLEDVFARLVSIPALLCRPTFELEVVLTHQDELRAQGGARAFRRRGWAVVGRSLSSVEGSVRIAGPEEAARLLPAGLPELFDTSELAEAMSAHRRLAQQTAYCLRALGALEPVGKRGGSVLYALAEPGSKRASTSARPAAVRETASAPVANPTDVPPGRRERGAKPGASVGRRGGRTAPAESPPPAPAGRGRRRQTPISAAERAAAALHCL
jgi:hypothetical protein